MSLSSSSNHTVVFDVVVVVGVVVIVVVDEIVATGVIEHWRSIRCRRLGAGQGSTSRALK